MGILGRGGGGATGGELESWLDAGYATAYRTAWLILRNPADAEEAVQEAFLRAWRFRASLPTGGEVAPWLHRVVVNACLSRLRAERTRHLRDWSPLPEEVAAPSGSPELSAVAGELQRAVADVLADLPDHLRVVVVLRYYAQLSEREIAEVIRRRPGTVKSRLHEARARLGADPRLGAIREEELR